MKTLEKIQTLFHSVRLDWLEIAANPADAERVAAIRQHIAWCYSELRSLAAE
jgi:hypothetical protein